MTYEQELQLITEQEHGEGTDFDDLDFMAQNEIHDMVQGANEQREIDFYERHYSRYYV